MRRGKRSRLFRKILRDPEVVARSVDFLRRRLAPAEPARLVLLPQVRVAGEVA